MSDRCLYLVAQKVARTLLIWLQNWPGSWSPAQGDRFGDPTGQLRRLIVEFLVQGIRCMDGFIISHNDGRTAYEIAHDRVYTGELACLANRCLDICIPHRKDALNGWKASGLGKHMLMMHTLQHFKDLSSLQDRFVVWPTAWLNETMYFPNMFLYFVVGVGMQQEGFSLRNIL